MTLSTEGRVRAAADPRAPLARLEALLDAGTAVALHPEDDSGATAVRGTVRGVKVYAFCTDARRMGGALGAGAAGHIIRTVEAALRERCPVVGVWHSAGARLGDGVGSLDAMSRMFAAFTRASGRIPQISVIVGPAAGAAAYGPALTDFVVMCEEGRLFVTGPAVVRQVTGEDIDMDALGGVKVHGPRSGVAHVTAAGEADAYDRARDLVELLGRPGWFDLPPAPPARDPGELLPVTARQAYDVRPLLRAVLDEQSLLELQPKWAPNVVVGLGRLTGRTVGVIANNPLRMGGCLDSLGAEKAARFVRCCDALGVPLVVVVDVPGYLPGAKQEWDGVVRRGAKLLHAFAEAVVPRVTLILRKSYGGAYIAMNSRGLGATAVFAWPGADLGVMGAEAAVEVLHRRELAAAAPQDRAATLARLVAGYTVASGGAGLAERLGLVDEVIEPVRTRHRLASALAEAPAGRGQHANIPL